MASRYLCPAKEQEKNQQVLLCLVLSMWFCNTHELLHILKVSLTFLTVLEKKKKFQTIPAPNPIF